MKELKKIIQEANPEIMKLKRGCNIKIRDQEYTIDYVGISQGRNAEDIYFVVTPNGLVTFKKVTENLGRPITLADVLLAFDKIDRILVMESLLSDNKTEWNLKEDLDWHYKNRLETIKFLKELLTK